MRRYNAKLLRVRLERRREYLKKHLSWSKHQEKLRIQQINKTLMSHLKRIEVEGMEERKKQVALIKEQTKVAPFKMQFMQLRKKVKLKEMISKEVEANETAVNEKKRELEYLAKLEAELKEQLASVVQVGCDPMETTHNVQCTKSSFSFASINNMNISLKNTMACFACSAPTRRIWGFGVLGFRAK
eukprot:TRINITY_DN3706_c0_g4_i3.p2 TRINITY_DN3706_c0_g4~~TRINITY_DN3706_c0_g4_i3.p2  ORF type:complete len:186 (-),score=60.34 TRINITY_DN3706_c0_g4_i3:323-880(-)